MYLIVRPWYGADGAPHRGVINQDLCHWGGGGSKGSFPKKSSNFQSKPGQRIKSAGRVPFCLVEPQEGNALQPWD